MINDTTKKVPRDMFKTEYFKLIKFYEYKNDEIVVHTVYHDTIEYKDNLYKLSVSSIDEGDRVRIERYDDQPLFYRATTNELLCKHDIALGKGNVVALTPLPKVEEANIEEVLLKNFKDSEDAVRFLKRMREQKPRYVYPQCRKLERIRKYYDDKKIIEGMKYCLKVDTCTVFELISWIIYDMGDDIVKKFVHVHTIRHYRDRALEIEKEKKERNGR